VVYKSVRPQVETLNNRRVVILGGGLSGIAVAYALARAGWQDVTILERGDSVGGLAGSFEQNGHFYPLGYHHILHRDRTLLFFLNLIGALPRVRWRSIRMLFWRGGRAYDLRRPRDVLGFPMSIGAKLGFGHLMIRAFLKRDWSDWAGRSAADLVDSWAGGEVREQIFDSLTNLKFELPCSEVSAAWLGARLSFREGSAPLGYIPGANWTKVLCDGLDSLLSALKVRIRLRTTVLRLHARSGSIHAAELPDGEVVSGDLFVSTVPTQVFATLISDDRTPDLHSIRYTALVSAICATSQPIHPDFYWMNLVPGAQTACGLFVLTSLNPTIGAPGESCVNFVTHLQDRNRPLFRLSDDELMTKYQRDFEELFGSKLKSSWFRISRVPMYSPIFFRNYRNPPIRSATFGNLYFAGNYRTFPSVASTGTALASGVECGETMLSDWGNNRICRPPWPKSAFGTCSGP
jgi:protoporphyrinogen oxidase